MTRQRYTIEHRTPKKGEQYICYNTQPPMVITVHDDWWQNKADVLVPVAPEWPDPPVIVIDESPDVDQGLLPVVAIRDRDGDYIYAGNSMEMDLLECRDSITKWHEYVPDGYVDHRHLTKVGTVSPIAEVIQVTESVRTLDGVTILEAPFYATRMDDADGNRYYYAAAYRIDPNIITSWKAIVN